MLYPKERKLFTMKDVTRACGISRAMFLRMEENGFLEPYRVDSESPPPAAFAFTAAIAATVLLLSRRRMRQ